MTTSVKDLVVFKPEPVVPVTKLDEILFRLEREKREEEEKERRCKRNRREIEFRKELNKRLDLHDAKIIPIKTDTGFCEACMSDILAAVADAADCYTF